MEDSARASCAALIARTRWNYSRDSKLSRKRSQTPDPYKPKGRPPGKAKPVLGDNILEWYHSLARVCQPEKCERVGHPPSLVPTAPRFAGRVVHPALGKLRFGPKAGLPVT